MRGEREDDLTVRAGNKGKRTDRTWSVIHLLSYIWLCSVLCIQDGHHILERMANQAPNPLAPRGAVQALWIITLIWYGIYAVLALTPFMHRRRTRFRRLTSALSLANIFLASICTAAIIKFKNTETFPESWWRTVLILLFFIFLFVSFSTFNGRRWYRLDAPGSHILIEDTAVSLYQGFMFYAIIWVCFSNSVVTGHHQSDDGPRETVFIAITCLMFLYLWPCIILFCHFVQGIVIAILFWSNADKLLSEDQCYNGTFRMKYEDCRYLSFMFILYGFICIGLSMAQLGYWIHWCVHMRWKLEKKNHF